MDERKVVADEVVRELLLQKSGVLTVTEFRLLPKQVQKDLIRDVMIEIGSGPRQMSRVSGMSYNIIQYMWKNNEEQWFKIQSKSVPLIDHTCNSDWSSDWLGLWKSTVSQQYVHYPRPQDSGNHEDCTYVELRTKKGKVIRIEAIDAPFSFSALPYTAQYIASKTHDYELQDEGKTFLNVSSTKIILK